jgi:hypothetical protein
MASGIILGGIPEILEPVAIKVRLYHAVRSKTLQHLISSEFCVFLPV